MRGIIIAAIIITLVISTVPAFAKERNLFKIIMASFEEGLNFGPEDEIKPIPREQVNIFQKCADGIQEGSARAKNMSLRGSRMK
jgi:hypothetical protein